MPEITGWRALLVRWHLLWASHHANRVVSHQARFDRVTARIDNLF